MNIFLLFVSMFIMIGYYIMSSPSQNVAQQETQYVIEQSDIRSVAECVVSTQNEVMYCRTFTDDCVARYNITSQYVHVNRLGSVIQKGSMSELCAEVERDPERVPYRTYIITTSYALPVEERNNMLDILEKYYSDRGNLGIIEGSRLIVPDSIVARTIPENVISNANLQDGQLAYIMQYRTPTLPGDEPVNPDPDQPECPEGMTLVNIAGIWKCRPLEPLTFCQEGTVWNSETMDCEPTEEFECENENATLVQMSDGTWVCLEPNADIECENGVIVLNSNTLEWECIKVENPSVFKENCNKKKPGYVFSLSDLKTTTGPTLKVKTISCGRCEKPTLDKETCDMYCLPDVSKLNTRTCFSGDPSCCTGDDKGIYFGFTKTSRTDGILGSDGKPVNIVLDEILDDYHAQNKKFNCMRCKYSSIDTSKSISPYTAICTGNSEGETVSVTRTDAPNNGCDTPVVVDDDELLMMQIENQEKGSNNDKPKEKQDDENIKVPGTDEEKGEQPADKTDQPTVLKPSFKPKKS